MEDLVNVPGLKKLKTRRFECIRMYIDGKKCQDLYDFFARKPPLAHGLSDIAHFLDLMVG